MKKIVLCVIGVIAFLTYFTSCKETNQDSTSNSQMSKFVKGEDFQIIFDKKDIIDSYKNG